jgi:anti-sigma-28 factor FlgM
MVERSRGHQEHDFEPSRKRPIAAKAAREELSAEDVAFCDVVIGRCPRLGYAELFEAVREDARERRERLRRIQRRIGQGTYQVPASAVARALVAEMDPGWPS